MEKTGGLGIMSTHIFHAITDITEEKRKLSTGTFSRILSLKTERGIVLITLLSEKLEYLTSNRLKQEDKGGE